MLPTSGFETLDDIRAYLLQFYTESLIENILIDKQLILQSPFIEYEGQLYIHSARAGFPRSNWKTAIHYLVEQEGRYAVVETSVLFATWHMLPNLVFGGSREEIFRQAQEQIIRGETYIRSDWLVENAISEVPYRFTFINGKIDSVSYIDERFIWSVFGPILIYNLE